MASDRDSITARARLLLLMLLGLALLGAFVFLVVNDFPLRSAIAVQ